MPPTLGKATLLVVSLLVVVAAFEVTIRALDLRAQTSRYWTYDAVLGWTQMPSREFTYRVLDGEEVTVEVNSQGFRDREHALEKPEGVKRIVAIGDSFTEAIQVNLDEVYANVLGEILEGRGDSRWEAISLGIADFGTAQALLALEEHGFAFDPDLVVLQIFPLNDLCNNTIELQGLCKSGNDVVRPYFRDEEGDLVLDYVQPIRQQLRKYSLTYRLIDGHYRYWRHTQDPPMKRALDPERLRALGFGGLPPLLHTYVPDAEQPEVIRKAWRVTEKILERIIAACRERNIPLVAMIAPFEVRVKGNWDGFSGGQPPPKLERDYADNRLEAFFERHEVPVVALRSIFVERASEALPFRGGHFGVGGHRVAAEALAELVETRFAGPLGLSGDSAEGSSATPTPKVSTP